MIKNNENRSLSVNDACGAAMFGQGPLMPLELEEGPDPSLRLRAAILAANVVVIPTSKWTSVILPNSLRTPWWSQDH